MNNNKAKLFALIPIIFFSVSGGPYGLEEIVASVGPINTLLLILLLPIVWTIPETMIVAELASSYPVQGGYYKWVQMSLGKFWGFMEGWWSILYTVIDLSLYPILFTTYFKLIFPDINFITVYLIQLTMIWSCAFINILGIKIVANVLTVFKFFIVIFFLLFIFLSFNHISWDLTPIINSANKSNINNLLFGLSLAFWNYIGWDNGSTVLHEIENPKVNYHRALFLTIPIIVFFYFFPVLAGLCIHTDWQSWKFGEFTYISNSINQPLLGVFLAIGGMVMCLGLFNSLLLSSTRVFLTMSEDKYFPVIFSKLHNKCQTPYFAIIFSSMIFSVLVLINLQSLIIYDVLLYLVAIFLEAVALVVLRKMNPGIKNAFRIPFSNLGMYFVVILASLIIIFMIYINFFYLSEVVDPLLSILFLSSGIPFYFFYKFKNN